MTKIKELVLKASAVHGTVSNVFTSKNDKDTYDIRCLSRYVLGVIVEDSGVRKCVNKITYRSKDSDFVKSHGLSIGCYVISIDEVGKYNCHNVESDRYIIIMEDVVSIAVHEKVKVAV